MGIEESYIQLDQGVLRESIPTHNFIWNNVQLCIARNRRHSASNYKGVARVTSRRARKGFEIKVNPDKHQSNELYRGLTLIEHTDSTIITNVNRDDASGCRLDTLTTHSQHATPSVKGQDVLTILIT